MLNNFLLLTVGLLALALASPSLLPSAERGMQEECGTAVCGAVVTVLTQRLAGCRLLLVASPGNTEVLACVLRGLRDKTRRGVVVIQDTSMLSTSLILPQLYRDVGAACWTVALFPDNTGRADTLENGGDAKTSMMNIDSNYKEGSSSVNIMKDNFFIERFMERSGLWLLPSIRVLLLDRDTSSALLQHQSLRNTRHLFLLQLAAGARHRIHNSDSGCAVDLYRRCLFCSAGGRSIVQLPNGKGASPMLLDQRLEPLVDLGGAVLRVVTMDFSPHVDYRRPPNYQPGGKVEPKDCLDFRMLDAVAAHLNFSYEVRQPPDGQWGVRNESGHFTGIVGSLEREEADLSMVLIPTPDRLKVMDHSRLYGEGTFVIISLKPQPPAPTWAFVESFRGTLWLELLAVAVTWGVLLWMMLKLWASWGNENKVTWNSLTSSILYGFGALLEDPPHRPPTNISAQVMVGWWWLVCMIITAAYRSALISHLTIPGLTRPINTFEDLLALKRWTWSAEIVILNMADKDFFLDSPSPVVREVYRRMEFCTLEESLRKVLKGRHSFITWKNYIDVKIASQFTDARGITPLYISTRRYPIFGGYSWGFRKGAPFLDTIRRVKQRLLETGILTYWLEDVIKQRVRVTRKDSQKEQDVAVMEALKPTSESGQVVLGLSHLQGPFYLLFGGFVISMITFMGEKILTAIRPCRKYVTSG